MTVPTNDLELLEHEVRRDLECLNHPPANWVPRANGSNGAPIVDVLIVGAGMCGQSAAFGLLREGVANVRIIDRAPRGLEGPWATYSRMETLRSPKQLTGPDLGVPSLTFRRWYEAQHGSAGWAALYKIPRVVWRDYLLWVRDVLALPVENDTTLETLQLGEGHVSARIRGTRGIETVLARRVVLAAGRDGSGAPRWPRFPSYDPQSARNRGRVFHSVDDIDFDSLAGKRIGVLGIGATGFDNAATALEHGAAEVSLFARRAILPQVNKSKWASFPGFQHGFAASDDATRWRFLTHINDAQVPPPHESVLRCDRFAGFRLHLGEVWRDLQVRDQMVEVTTAMRAYQFDAVILAVGFDVNLADRPELASFRDQIMLWSDRVSDSEAARHPDEARFPYLGPGFELMSRHQATSSLSRIHVFNWGSTMSHGPIAGDIPGLGVAVNRLVIAIARTLFVETSASLYQALEAYDEPELKPTRYYVPLPR